MAVKNVRTSAEVATIAARTLKDPRASSIEKSLAGSALSNRRKVRQRSEPEPELERCF